MENSGYTIQKEGDRMDGNRFISWLLCSPLHGLLSHGTMLLTVRGRKTGKPYTTPVDYYEEDGFIWVLSNRDRSWWRNLQGGANVELFLKGKSEKGFAGLELDQKAVEVQLVKYIQHKPYTAKPLGIQMKNKIPNTEDVARVAGDKLFVKIQLSK
jgi:deazaflavin-dependent oxidoreductase (nitroreductase family)